MENTDDAKRIERAWACEIYRGEIIKMSKGILRHIRRVGLPIDLGDLVNSGFIGLLKALDHYNADKGEFGPYARYIIRKEVILCIRRISPILPRHRWHGRYPTQVRADTDG